MKRVFAPPPPSAMAKEIRRRAKVSLQLAQTRADLFTGAIYGD